MISRERLWPVLNQLVRGHATAYRLSHGVIGHRFPGAPPSLLLDHVGAKSGAKRTAVLTYIPDGDNFVIVASKGGHPQHPAWFHNLRAHPEATIQVGSKRHSVRARVATPAERERLWPRAVETWPGYAGYQRRTDREIPLVILERR